MNKPKKLRAHARRPLIEVLEARQLLALTLIDVVPGDLSSTPTNTTGINIVGSGRVAPGGPVYFSATDGAGYDLYKSDGTSAGTVQVKDINFPTDSSLSTSFANLATIAGVTYFSNQNSPSGIWKTDGTSAGTTLLRSFSGSSTVGPQIAVNGRIVFSATDTTGSELWVTDGTVGGTVLLKDIRPGSTGSSPSFMGVVGTTLFFTADDGTTGTELWKTDGTAAGTVQVKDINPGFGTSSPLTFGSLAIGGILYFTANDGTTGTELWKTDGTAAGTTLVKDIVVGSGSPSVLNLTDFNGTLVFYASSALWKSDGTATGTVQVKSFTAAGGGTYSTSVKPVVVGATLYLVGSTTTSGEELWKSDGTTAGTVQVKEIAAGAASAFPTSLTNVAGKLVFIADDNGISGYEPWTSDGTSVGTTQLRDIQPGNGANSSSPVMAGVVNNTLYFTADDGSTGRELWKTDGTIAGTLPVKDIAPGAKSSGVSGFAVVGSRPVFWATDGVSGTEPWTTDGTAGGTVMLKNINTTGVASFPSEFAEFNEKVYFYASDDDHGSELWSSDGTAAGTSLVSDIFPGISASNGFPNSGGPSYLVTVGSSLYFSANNTTGVELWKTDGTAGGTALVKNINTGTGASSNPRSLVNLNGTLLFTADDGGTGRELWRSDGTASGTTLVKDIRPGVGLGSAPTNLFVIGSTVYFTADDGTNRNGLWKSDGTAAGTVLVKNMTAAFAVTTSMVQLGGILYFNGIDSATGSELWRSDGTTAGTFLVKDIRPGTTGGLVENVSTSGGPVVSGNRIFFRANDGSTGEELWSSDGTTAGTTLVKDIRAAGNSSPSWLVDVSGVLYFSADNATNGAELWRSDGTAAGTILVKDVRTGASTSAPSDTTNFNGVLYFSADDGVHGIELWQSDGTAAGTTLAADIRPGLPASSPVGNRSIGFLESKPHLYGFLVAGNKLFGRADDGTHGTELWVYKPEVSGPPSVAEGATYGLTLDSVTSVPGNSGNAWTINWGDGSTSIIPGEPTGASHIYADGPATRTVTATYATPGGGFTRTITVQVTNAPPVPTITGAPQSSPEGTPITLFGSAIDPGTIDTYSLSWSVTHATGVPYTTGTGASFTFRPSDEGVFLVTLSATDNNGGVGKTTTTINVFNVGPTAIITSAPTTIAEGGLISLAGTASDPGPLDAIASLVWTVTRNGVAYRTGRDDYFSFVAEDDGTYVVSLVATDTDGGSGSPATATILVTNVAPIASYSNPPSGDLPEGTILTPTASVIDPGILDTFTYAWIVHKNGVTYQTASTPSFRFVADDEGTFAFDLTVTDNSGGVSVAPTVTSNAFNVAPSATLINLPTMMQPGNSVTIGSQATDPGLFDVITYAWTVLRNGQPYGTASTPSLAFAPVQSGLYAVSLVVSDNDGGMHPPIQATIQVGPALGAVTAPVSITEGSSATIGGPIVNASANATSLRIDWRDGTVQTLALAAGATSFTASHTYLDDKPSVTTSDPYDVALELYNGGSDLSSLATVRVIVLNSNPTLSNVIFLATSISEGQSSTLTGHIADASPLDSFTLTVNWRDNTDPDLIELPAGTTEFSVSHTFHDNPTFVSVVLRDDDSGSTMASPAITIANLPPAVSLVGTLFDFDTYPEGKNLSASAVVSDPGVSDSFSYAWTVTKNGSVYRTYTGSDLTFRLDDNGSYRVTLAVTDDDGAIGFATPVNFLATNLSPESDFIGFVPYTVAGTTLDLSAHVVDQGTADTQSFQWTVTRSGEPFASQQSASPDFSLYLPENGEYLLSLITTDDDGGTDLIRDTIHVGPALGNLALDATTLNEGSTLHLDGTIINPDMSHSMTLVISWGDGDSESVVVSAGASTYHRSHVYLDDNPTKTASDFYEVRVDLTATQVVDTASSTIQVRNVAPTIVSATASPNPVDEGTPVVLHVVITDPGSVDSHNVVLDWGDGINETFSFAAGETTFDIPHVYVDDRKQDESGGPRTIQLEVRDDDNGVSEVASTSVTVRNVVPYFQTITLTSPLNEGDTAVLQGFVSDAGSYDELSLRIDWGDGTIEVVPAGATHFNAFQPISFEHRHRYSDNPTGQPQGSYVVTTTPLDDDGGVGSAVTRSIQVKNVAPIIAITGAPTRADRSSFVNLGSTVTDPGSDTFRYLWTVKRNGSTVQTGTSSSLTISPSVTGNYTVTLVVTDDDGGTSLPGSVSFLVGPLLTNVSVPPFVDEGSVVLLTGMILDPDPAHTQPLVIDWGDGSAAETVNLAAGASTFNIPHIYRDDNPTITSVDHVNIALSLSDGNVTTTASTGQTVRDVAPTLGTVTLSANSVLEGGSITITGTFTDPGDDVHRVLVNWGESIFSSVTNLVRGARTFTIEHIYYDDVTPGTTFDDLNITIRLVDDDNLFDTREGMDVVRVFDVAPSLVSLNGLPPVGQSWPEGVPFDFTAISSDPANGDGVIRDPVTASFIVTYLATGAAQPIVISTTSNFLADDNGLYTIYTTLTDDDGLSGYNTRNLIVVNRSPSAELTSNGPLDEGQPITVRFQYIFDPSQADVAAGFRYSYDYNNDGKYEVVDSPNPEQEIPYSVFGSDGSYTVRGKIADKDGGSLVVTTAIVIRNVPPSAQIVNPPATAIEGNAITLTGAANDPGGDSLTYLWSVLKNGSPFGTAGTATTYTFTPDDNGTYVVSFAATDGSTGSKDTATINVSNARPISVIKNYQPFVARGATIALATAAHDPGAADTLTYHWSVLRNGAAFSESDGPSLIFSPSHSGTYLVSHTATDDDGDTSSPAQVTIEVGPFLTNVTINSSITEGDAAVLNGTVLNPDPTRTLQLVIDWADGPATTLNLAPGQSTFSASHTYLDDNPTFTSSDLYRVSLTLADEDTTRSASTSVIVNDAEPTVTGVVLAKGVLNEGEEVGLDFTIADRGVLDTLLVTVSWITGDVETFVATGSGPYHRTHQYYDQLPNIAFQEGFVTISVSDDDGLSGASAPIPVRVNDVAPTTTVTASASTSVIGTPLNFSATVFDPNPFDFLTSSWTVTRNGTAYNPGTPSHGLMFSFTPTRNGVYEVSFLTADDDGLSSGVVKSVHVGPKLGVVSYNVGSILEGGSATLSGTIINPSPTLSLPLLIDWQDGTATTLTLAPNQTTFSTTHIYGDDGASGTPADDMTARLTLTDPDVVSQASAVIRVNNVAPMVSATVSPRVNEGGIATLLATLLDVAADSFRGQVDWGDGTTETLTLPAGTTGFSRTHLYADDAPSGTSSDVFHVVVSVVDDDGGSATAPTVDVQVDDVAPTATIQGAPGGPVAEGTVLPLVGVAIDPGTDTFRYSWRVERAGVTLTTATLATPGFAFAPPDNDTYTITLTITDDDGLASPPVFVTVTGTNRPPVATIGSSLPANPNEGTTYTLAANVSDPGSADTFTYVWTITKDGAAYDVPGENRSSSTYAFKPRDNGIYAMSLLVTDDDGGVAPLVSLANVSVVNVAPQPSLSLPASSPQGALVIASKSVVEPGEYDGNAGFLYQWTTTRVINGVDQPWADLSATSTSSNYSIRPTVIGRYRISLAVRDKDGGVGTTSQTIDITSLPPSVTLSGVPTSAIGEGTSFNVTGQATKPGVTGEAYSYSLKVERFNGSGYVQEGSVSSFPSTTVLATISVRPLDSGSYRLTLTATDSTNAVGSTTATFASTNLSPTWTFTSSNYSATLGVSQSFSFGAATDPSSVDQSSLSYQLDFDNNGVFETISASPTVSHTFSTSGSFPVRGRVLDKDGLFSPAVLATVTVQPDTTPRFLSLAFNQVNEDGLAVLSADISDAAGVVQNYRAQVDWSDGTFSILALGAGLKKFTTSHSFSIGSPTTVSAKVTLLASDESRALTAADPSGYQGFLAYLYIGPQFINLSRGASGVSTLTGWTNTVSPTASVRDDGAVSLSLGNQKFRFAGVDYSSVWVSTNGIITFDGADTEFRNNNLSSGTRKIAALWDDWSLNSSTTNIGEVLAKFVDLDNNGSIDHLIVQWDKVVPYPGSGSNTATFQAVLELNTGTRGGNIELDSSDLYLADPVHDYGKSATVGIRDGSGSSDRVLISLDSDFLSTLGSSFRIADSSTRSYSASTITQSSAPSVFSLNVTPDVTNVTVATALVLTSEPVTTASLRSALRLTLNNVAVAVPAGVTVTLRENTTTLYDIAGLGGATASNGTYILSVDGTALRDFVNKAGVGSASDSWVMDSVAPISAVTGAATAAALQFPVTVTTNTNPPGASYNISTLSSVSVEVSTDGVNYLPLTTLSPPANTLGTWTTSLNFTGESNRTYTFRSFARDTAGNLEVKPVNNTSSYRSVSVPDFSAPTTAVTSVNSSAATFVVNFQGSDVGTSGIASFDLYASVDAATATKVGAFGAGSPLGGGLYLGSTTYQAITDGLPHSYRFFTRGTDVANNVEAAPPGSTDDVLVSNRTFAAPISLNLTTFDVQHGSTQRSFIRYVTLGFNMAGPALQAIIDSVLDADPSNDRITLVKYDLDGNNPTTVSLTGPTGVAADYQTKLTVLDHAIEMDFGRGGVGSGGLDSARNSINGDGYYSVQVDLDGSVAMYEADRRFYRLLGDVDGNRSVDDQDVGFYAIPANGLERDTNGDGLVNSTDSLLITRSKGRRLKTELRVDD